MTMKKIETYKKNSRVMKKKLMLRNQKKISNLYVL